MAWRPIEQMRSVLRNHKKNSGYENNVIKIPFRVESKAFLPFHNAQCLLAGIPRKQSVPNALSEPLREVITQSCWSKATV